MSSFDDEFGLFGEEGDDAERRSTLGARNISAKDSPSSGTDVEPEDAQPRARTEGVDRERGGKRGAGRDARGYPPRPSRVAGDPVAAARRARDILEFMAKRLVSKPEIVEVELFADEDGKPVIELVVDPEDLGKVIGRSGRVAHALRTIVRATAEGRISVDILDTDEIAESDVDETDE